MQTILITGANGFIATYLIKRLLKIKMEIIATGKGPKRQHFEDGQFIYEPLDFTDESATAALFDKYKPHVVIHCGAMAKPDECELNKEAAFSVNVTGTKNLLNNAAKHRSFFIFVSTDFVFAGENKTYTEEDRPAPVNYYGLTKLLAENEVQEYPYLWSILRPVLVYGKPSAGRDNLLTFTANALKQNKELNIFNDQLRTPTYVEDVAFAIEKMMERKATGIFHIAGPDALTPYNIAVIVANHLHLAEKLIKKATAATFHQPAKRPPQTTFDISKAKNILGFSPTPFNKGLQKTFEA